MGDERRKHRLRRDLNDLVRDDGGHVTESKVWSNIGKAVATFLLLWHSEYVIDHGDAMFILLIIIVAPDLVKKFMHMKWGGNGATSAKQTVRQGEAAG